MLPPTATFHGGETQAAKLDFAKWIDTFCPADPTSLTLTQTIFHFCLATLSNLKNLILIFFLAWFSLFRAFCE